MTVMNGVLIGKSTDAELSEQLLSTAWTPSSLRFKLTLALALLGTGLLILGVTYTVLSGIGLWGNNIPVAWGFGIINFVWWIGIGHAGTFISAILLLLEQSWRTSINRFAEAMTLFAVVQAALFPLLHLGRPWFAYWLFPYPATMGVWPQVKSALPWDAAAITTYGLTSLLFFYMGLIPDFAALRDRAPKRSQRIIYGLFALGWRGSLRAFRHYRIGYGLLAGIATPLVVSVHSIVSTDFAIALVPGWHSTIFPPFFVAGAILSGFAMVLMILIPTRALYGLHNVVTARHIDNLGKLILVTGSIVAGCYVIEFFIAWYSGDRYEMYQFLVARPFGPSAIMFWIMITGNVVGPQLFWSKRVRHNLPLVVALTMLINVGMWAERFVIIVLGLQQEFLPSAWELFIPTWVDLSILFGTVGFFFLLFLLFLRFVPFISVMEVKELKHDLRREEAHGEH